MDCSSQLERLSWIESKRERLTLFTSLPLGAAISWLVIDPENTPPRNMNLYQFILCINICNFKTLESVPP